MNQRKPYPFYILELTKYCNNNCIYCYNYWKQPGAICSKEELSTKQWFYIIDKLDKETQCATLALSGGEPVIRKDFLEILSFISEKGIKPILITNAALIDEKMAKAVVERGVSLVEITLLSSKKDIHNKMAKANVWDKVLEAIVNFKSLGIKVIIVFVATKLNLPTFRQTLELAIALNTDGLMFNRFNPGGEGIRHLEELLPDIKELEEALQIAQNYSYYYRYPISCSIPMQPCLFNMQAYPKLGRGFCSAGTEKAYYTIGPDGKVRPCNHTPTVIGDYFKQSMEEIQKSEVLEEFKKAFPPICKPCPMNTVCQGGCKASAQVCYGSIYEEEPCLKVNIPNHPLLSKAKEDLKKLSPC